LRVDRRYFLRVTLLLYGVWFVSFQSVGRYAQSLPTHDLTTWVDRTIPLIPAFVWPYEFTYVFPLVPVFLVQDRRRFHRGVVALLLAMTGAFVVYVKFPVAFSKPELGGSLSEWVLAMEYWVDFHPGANNLPSLHVTFAWLVCLVCLRQGPRRSVDALLLAMAALISVSTLFVKQHLVSDVVAGIAWAFTCWKMAGWLWPSRQVSREALDGEADPVSRAA
jgi:membrane-associated phospholipid phosphatase